MAEIITTAGKASTERTKAQDELSTLVQNAQNDNMAFQEKMQKINELAEKSKPLVEVLKSKENEKTTLIKMNATAKERYEEATVKKNELMSGWGFGSNKLAAQTFSKKIQQYEELFGKIQMRTATQDIDQLVLNFMQSEEKVHC